MRLWAICAISMMVFSASVQAGHTPEEERDEATEGTIRLSIPEPMYFDLVRPLGARRGEVEVNALFVKRSGEHLGWAPEVEAVVGEGVALEFELPMEGVEIETRLFANVHLQVGIGAARGPMQPWKPVVGWRLVRELN